MFEFIDPEIEAAGMDLSYNIGKELRKIMLECGVTSEEIEKTMKEVRAGIYINGVPLDAIACQACSGRGWVKQ